MKENKTVDEIRNQLIIEIKDMIFDNSLKFDGQSKLIEGIGLDSLDIAQLMLAGEKFVASKVKEESVNWSNVTTLNDLVMVIYQCQF